MPAGLRFNIDVTRTITLGTDEVGGAIVTGTLVYHNIPGSVTANKSSVLLREQGLETEPTYELTTHSKGIVLYEEDLIQVICDPSHPYYQKKFRITGVQVSKRIPRIGHIHASLAPVKRTRESN